MDGIQITVVVVLAVIIGFYAYSNYYVSKNMKKLNSSDFEAGFKGEQLIDVRTPKEFKEKHVLGARNIPFNAIRQSTKAIIPGKSVYLYCNNGKTSRRAAIYLFSKGYNQLFILKGGMNNWTGKTKESK